MRLIEIMSLFVVLGSGLNADSLWNEVAMSPQEEEFVHTLC